MTLDAELSQSQDERLQEILAAYLRDVEAGRNPDRAEILARHPDLASELQEFFAGQEQLGRLAAPLRQAVQSPSDYGITGTLGDFRIVREVGRGGMGIVYEAEQISLHRRVALKVLPFAATMDPRHLQRFHNEAQAAACLHHTNIVPVHFVGCERGVHFYAMQFIDGQPLSQIIRQMRQTEKKTPTAGENTVAYQPPAGEADSTPLPAAELTPLTGEGRRSRDYYRKVAELGIQAAEALDHAHQLGIVHRDIKPGNLMLDGRGNLWVTDFGLAHMQHSEASLTMTGQALGTPRYMSPEQALAKRVPIDHRTDVYSLGVTLYELLTLRQAFGSEDRQELLRQIAFDEPVRPRRLARDIPAELEIIVLKAMEKRPQDRYATAQDLAEDLRRWLEDRPIQARRPTQLQRARKWLRRHPAVVRSAILMLLLAAGASATAAGLLWQEQGRTKAAWDAEYDQRQIAEANEAMALAAAQEATQARKVAEKFNDILGSIFRDLNPQLVEKGGPALRMELWKRLDGAAQMLEGESLGDPLTVARLQSQLALSMAGLGKFDKAISLMEQARQMREAALGADHPDTLSSKYSLADFYHAQGNHDQAEALLQEVLRAQTTRLGATHLETLKRKHDLARVYMSRDKYDRAEPLFQEVLRALKAQPGSDDSLAEDCTNCLATMYWRMGKLDRSIPLFEELVPSFKAKHGADNIRTLMAAINLAQNYSTVGRHDAAAAVLDEYLPRARSVLPGGSPLLNFAVRTRAGIYEKAGRLDMAEPLRRELVELTKHESRGEVGAGVYNYAGTMAELGWNLLRQKKYVESEKVLRECLIVCEKTLPDNWMTFWVHSILGDALLGQAKYAEAEPFLLKGHDGLKQRRDKTPPAAKSKLTEAVTCLVQLYDAWGKKDQADRWRQELKSAPAKQKK